jgi:magnesium chelatase family protein
MRVFSFFENEGRLEPVEVELQLLKGLPQLNVIGLPDTHLKESALRIKSSLTAQGYQWPKGHQVVVNLRPSHLRKQSRGLELAMALALIWETGQAVCPWDLKANEIFIYGELGLGGGVRCPEDVETTPVTDSILVLGQKKGLVEGRYFEITQLSDLRGELCFRENFVQQSWQRPPIPDVNFSETVARLLKIVALSEASILLAGPQGTGKSTWAQALHVLLAEPAEENWQVTRSLHAREGRKLSWRPMVNPHHTIPPISMIGGGYPLFPGEIAKAHGGLLLLDELLQFHPNVLEALREPVEAGQMRITRMGQTRIWPAKFQFVGTTNLCPCGRLSPGWSQGCSFSLRKCRSTWERLSGPVLDRFDILSFTQDWNRGEKTVSVAEILIEVEDLRRGQANVEVGTIPAALVDPMMSLRRQKAMARVAKSLAILAKSDRVASKHWIEAFNLCVKPLESFRQLFA